MQFCPAAVTLASCSEGNGPLMSAFVVLWPILDQFPPGGRGIEICWCKWLKVWDNVSLNNQEMGSKRTVKPEPEPEPPSSRNIYPGSDNCDRGGARQINADIVALLLALIEFNFKRLFAPGTIVKYKPDCRSVLKFVTSHHASFGGEIMSHKAYSSFHRSMLADLRLFSQYFSVLLLWKMSKSCGR